MTGENAAPESLARRVARLRRERELTAEDLGAPEFSAAFVQAVEAGRILPSAGALVVLARHLAIPASALAALTPFVVTHPDWAAYGEDLLYQIESARPLLYTQPRAFIQALDALAGTYITAFAHLPRWPRYRFHYLRANAHLRAGQPGGARPDLAMALFLARQLPEAGQEVARVRNAIGALYYLLDQPARALAYHHQNLQAINTGAVKDLTLGLLIYTNLANACWALHDLVQAVAIYHEALRRLVDVEYPEQQAEIYAGLSLAHQALREWDPANHYAEQALALREGTGSPRDIARLATNLAMIRIARQDYTGVDALLARAHHLLSAPGEEGLLSVTLTCYALLELHRGDLAAAAAHADGAVRLSAMVFAEQDPASGILARAYAGRTYARALGAAGQVAERQGQVDQADCCFGRALEVVAGSEYAETAWELRQIYADLLQARGDHVRAGIQYRRLLHRSTARV